MTKNEFQKKYHTYRTLSGEDAKKEAERANKEGIDGDKAVAINFGRIGWALMLASAARFAEEAHLIPPQEVT